MVLDGEALHCVGLWQCFNLHIGYRYIANADAAQLDGGGGSPIFEGGVSPISKSEVPDLRPGCI